MSAKTARAAAGLFLAPVVLVLAISSCTLTAPGGGSAAATLGITMKQPAAPIASIAVTVTASGMAPIAETVSVGQTEIVLEVPAGPARTFRVLVNTASVTFMDETTVDLAAGENVTVTLQPVLSATQIIVPDAENRQLVQISDLRGTGWIDLGPEDFYPAAEEYMLIPWDVDFDSEGRIYVANMASDSFIPGVFRFDSINSPRDYETVDSVWAVSVAVDRIRGLVYYMDGDTGTLYQKSINGLAEEPVPFDIAGQFEVTEIKGIAVDDQGQVYLANLAEGVVVKLDPDLGVFTDWSDWVDDTWDVMVKGNSVYVASLGGEGAPRVIQLSKDLDFLDAYTGPIDDPLVGPKRFVATINPELYVIDEGYDGFDNLFNRVVGLGTQLGSDWETYGTTGLAGQVGKFQFFEADF